MAEEEVVVPETTEEVTPEVTPEESGEEVDWEAKAKKAEELANNYKVRAEKAEKKSKETVQTETRDGLSNKDVIFLAKADIHEDDMDEVLDWAKFKKVPVSEAYKQLKTTLQVRTEERKSAQVSNTNNARRGSSKVDGETLISNARAGKIPESDADITALLKAKMGVK